MDEGRLLNSGRRLVESLTPPENFNEWLLGTHYPDKYILHLERTDRQYSRLTTLPSRECGSRNKSSSRLLRASPVAGPLFLQEVSDDEAAKKEAYTEDAAVIEQSVSSAHAGHATEDTPTPKSKADRCASRKKMTQGNFRGTNNTRAIGRTPLPNASLESAHTRDKLRESYYRMKEAAAFAHNFPALLTPYNRPVFHLFGEEELPGKKFATSSGRSCGGTRGNPPSDSQHTFVSKYGGYEAQNLRSWMSNGARTPASGPPALYPSLHRKYNAGM